MDTREGWLVAGRYRLLRELGVGASGIVWEAWDTRLTRSVALKQLRLPADVPEAELRHVAEQALRRACVATRLQHPNAVTVFDVVDDDTRPPILVLEYVPARSLAAVHADGPLTPTQVAAIGAQVSSALVAAHAAGIPHRDIKPGNVLITEHGVAKITDFSTTTSAPRAYRAPEVIRGEPAGEPADVYALGATLTAVLPGGRTPLTGLLAAMTHHDPASRPTMERAHTALAALAPPDLAFDLAAPTVVTVPPTRLNLRPVPEPEVVVHRPRRRSAMIPVLVAGALLAVPIAMAVARYSDTTSTTRTASVPTTTPAPDPAKAQQAILDYYGLLPHDTATAWSRLSPNLQAQDRQGYERFWSGVRDLKLVTAPQVDGVTANVRIDYANGADRVHETHQLGLVAANGVVLINSDQVVLTEIIKKAKGK